MLSAVRPCLSSVLKSSSTGVTAAGRASAPSPLSSSPLPPLLSPNPSPIPLPGLVGLRSPPRCSASASSPSPWAWKARNAVSSP